MQNQQDAFIIEGLKQVDINEPLRMLYNNYCNDVIRYICNNNGSAEDGADIFQEAILEFVDIVKKDNFLGKSSIKTFLFAISKNLWRQELRSRDRRNKREKLFNGNEQIQLPEADERWFNKDRQKAMDKIYGEIGDVCRNILQGFYYEELSMKDLLKKFNYENEQVLRNRKSLCLKKIKNALQQDTALSSIFKNVFSYAK